MGFFNTLKQALLKIADRGSVEQKARSIYNSGGVNFISVTPNQDIGRATWEFDVTSTSGEIYPIYLDTTTDNPNDTIGWDDIICGCDWSKWNYDRAPEYMHLSDMYCSHAMAVDMWLQDKGQQEYDRAIREEESGQMEERIDDETGPRRTRPKERLIQDRAKEKGTTPAEERRQLEREDQGNRRNLYDQNEPVEQEQLPEEEPQEEPQEEFPERQTEPNRNPTQRVYQPNEEVLKPRMPGREPTNPREPVDEFSGEEYEDYYEEENTRGRNRNRRRSSWWKGSDSWDLENEQSLNGFNQSFVIDYEGNVSEGDYNTNHGQLLDELVEFGSDVSGFMRGVIVDGDVTVVPYSSKYPDDFSSEQYKALCDYLTEHYLASNLNEGIVSVETNKGTYEDTILDAADSFENSNLDSKGFRQSLWWSTPNNSSQALREPYSSLRKDSELEVGTLVRDFAGDEGEIVEVYEDGEFKVHYGFDNFGDPMWATMDSDEIDEISAYSESPEDPESIYENMIEIVDDIPDPQQNLHKWLYDFNGNMYCWPVQSIYGEGGAPHHYDVAEALGIDPMAYGYAWKEDIVLVRADSLFEDMEEDFKEIAYTFQDYSTMLEYEDKYYGINDLLGEEVHGSFQKKAGREYIFVVNTKGDYAIATEGYHTNIVSQVPMDGYKSLWIRGWVSEYGAFILPYAPTGVEEGELTSQQREVASDILQEIMGKMIEKGYQQSDFEMLEFDLEYPDEQFSGTYIDGISYLSSNDPVTGMLVVH